VNPISLLTADNNGLVLKISAPVNGMGNSIQAQAFLGIGTNVNNTPASASLSVLTADPNEQDECFTYFQTQWNGNKICGFLDSGSNSLVFPNLTSQPIPTDSNGIYVPTSLTSYSATNIGYDGKNFSVGFSLANVKAQVGVDSILQYWGVTDPSGPISGDFDWGFPFFMGRTVYIGLEGRSSSLGSGLYWAY
jgi:hypothetical protein